MLIAGGPAQARSLRSFSTPTANAPEPGICRFESEAIFPVQRRDSDRIGQLYGYSAGAGCSVYKAGRFDFEAGFDWRESSDVRATQFTDPFQAFARVTYRAQAYTEENNDADAWSAALGIDDIGLGGGRSDFDVAYLVGQKRLGPIEFEFGGFTSRADHDASGAILALRRHFSRTELGFEWRSGHSRDGYGFAGLRIEFTETLTATIGYAFANDRDSMRDWGLLRLSITQ